MLDYYFSISVSTWLKIDQRFLLCYLSWVLEDLIVIIIKRTISLVILNWQVDNFLFLKIDEQNLRETLNQEYLVINIRKINKIFLPKYFFSKDRMYCLSLANICSFWRCPCFSLFFADSASSSFLSCKLWTFICLLTFFISFSVLQKNFKKSKSITESITITIKDKSFQ